MRSSMRTQILVPFALLSISAVAVTSLFSALAAAWHGDQERAVQLRNMVRTLGDAMFPYTDKHVLEKMKGLSGTEFVALGPRGRIDAATLSLTASELRLPDHVPSADAVDRLTDFPVVEIRGVRYFVTAVPGKPATPDVALYLLYPEQTWRQDRFAATWPPLVVGTSAAVAALALAVWLSHRFARRIGLVRTQLAQLATREYVQMPLTGPNDELFDLQSSANQLSQRLSKFENEVAQNERLRLLAQLAGGLAHQLRNAVTGARLAVQLHARRCGVQRSPQAPSSGPGVQCSPQSPSAGLGAAEMDESLDIALRQLSLTEEQIQGLLSLGARRPQEQTPGDLRQIVLEVEKLVQPMCRHSHVRLEASTELDDAAAVVPDTAAMRAALVNLSLNALEAAGAGGSVWIEARTDSGAVELRVIDTGAGPPEDVRETLFEPFVTSKPEGVGLGLMLAQHAAAGCGGDLRCLRENDRTVFMMRWTLQGERGASAPCLVASNCGPQTVLPLAPPEYRGGENQGAAHP